MEPEGTHFPEAEFFGVRVPEGEHVVVGVAETEEDQMFETYHLTQVALGPSPASGRHTVYMETDGQQKVAIGTLQRDRVEQFQVDFMSQAPVQISHTGGSDVFVSGFKVIAPIMEEEQQRETDSDDEPFSPEGLEDDDEEEDDEEVEEEEGDEMFANVQDDDEEEDEEGDPADVQAMKLHFKQEKLERQLPKLKKGAAPAAAAAAADDEDDDEDDDEEAVGEGAPGEDGFGGLQPQEFSDMDDDDEEEDEDDDEDEDALQRAVDDDEDDEEDEEGDDDDEEEAPALVSRPQAGKKRPAQATDATPQPAKQAKAAGGGKQPNSQTAPAAAAGTPGSSSAAEQSWAKDIQAHLKKNGASKLAALGSNVPKPTGIPKTTKMKKFLENRPDLFTVDPNTQLVTLKQ